MQVPQKWKLVLPKGNVAEDEEGEIHIPSLAAVPSHWICLTTASPNLPRSPGRINPLPVLVPRDLQLSDPL